MNFIPELTIAIGQPENDQILYLAVMLHDCGWSMLSIPEIADSVDYKGIASTPIAAYAKLKHNIFGTALAFRLLDEYTFE